MASQRMIEVEGKKIYLKWNRRAKAAWERETGITWSDLAGKYDDKGNMTKEPHSLTTHESMQLVKAIVDEGHRAEGVKYDGTIDDIYDLCDDHGLEEIAVELIFPNVKGEPENSPSTRETSQSEQSIYHTDIA